MNNVDRIGISLLVDNQERMNKNLEDIKILLDHLVESKLTKYETRDIGKN